MATILRDQIRNRQLYNRQLLHTISYFVENCPDWRFHQILQNIGITTRDGGDMFYEESFETLERLKNSIDLDKIKSL